MAVCFFITFGMEAPSAEGMLKGLVVPSVASYARVQAVGLVGAVISK